MKRWTTILLPMALVSVTTVGTLVIAFSSNAEPKSPAGPRVTISKATTFLTRPVDKEGHVDYIEALNQRSSIGVTPKNNAAVLLWKAFGPAEIPKPLRPAVFKRLGIKPLPEQGPYYVPLYLLTAKLKGKERNFAHQQLSEHFDKCMSGPWKRTQYSDIFNWLVLNEEPLEQLTLAGQRKRFYVPFVRSANADPGDSLSAVQMSTYQSMRQTGRILTIRAMLRFGEGKTAAALKDLLTIRRLSRLYGQEPLVISSLIAGAVDSTVSWAGAKLAQTGKLTAAQAITYGAKLNELGPFTKGARSTHEIERIEMLDFATRLARLEKPKEAILRLIPDHSQRKTQDPRGVKVVPRKNTIIAAIKRAPPIHTIIDWNIVTADINVWFDRAKAANSLGNLPKRLRALAKLGDESQQLARASQKTPVFLKRRKFKPADREAASHWLANVLIGRVGYMSQWLYAELRTNVRFHQSRLAFALAAYRAESGKYPDKLSKLTKKCIRKIPIDPMSRSGKPFIYVRTKSGYLLYSVGSNGQDDGGRFHYDRTAEVQYDDIVAPTQKR